jgi:hypothetical protein
MTIAADLPQRPFTRAEAAALGIGRSSFYRLIDSGVLRPVVRGVVVPADLPDTHETRAAAVALVVPDHHVAVDRTASAVHGVNTFTYAERDAPPPVEACALRGRNPTHLTGVRGRSRDLIAEDVMLIGDLRVTTPLRTSCDLGCALRRREAYAAMVGLTRAHGLAPEQYARMLRRFGRRRGVVQLRELVALVDTRLESARECWTYLAIHDAGLPHPEPQHWVVVDGVPTFRLDFAYLGARVCIEYNGFDAHDVTVGQRDYDEARRAWLEENGWTVIVVRIGDFTGDALDRWLSELREALRPTYSNRRW